MAQVSAHLSLLSNGIGGGVSVALSPEAAQALREQQVSLSQQLDRLVPLQPLAQMNQLTILSKTKKTKGTTLASGDNGADDDKAAPPPLSSATSDPTTTNKSPKSVVPDQDHAHSDKNPTTTTNTKSPRQMDQDEEEEEDDPLLPVVAISLERLVGYVSATEDEVAVIRAQLVEAMWNQSNHEKAISTTKEDDNDSTNKSDNQSAARSTKWKSPPPDFDQHVMELLECGVATFYANRNEVVVDTTKQGTIASSSVLIISYPKTLSQPSHPIPQQGDEGQQGLTNEKNLLVTVDTKQLWNGIQRRGIRCSSRLDDATVAAFTTKTTLAVSTNPAPIAPNKTRAIHETIQTLFQYLQRCNRGLFWKHDMSLELQRLIHDEQAHKEYRHYHSKQARLERQQKLEQLYSIRDALQNQCHVQDAQVQQLEHERGVKVAKELLQLKNQRQGGGVNNLLVGGLQALDLESTTPMAFPSEFKLFSFQDDDDDEGNGYEEDDWGSNQDSYNNNDDDDDDNDSTYSGDDDEDVDAADAADDNDEPRREDAEKSNVIFIMEDDDGYAAQDDNDYLRKDGKDVRDVRVVRVKPAVLTDNDIDVSSNLPVVAGEEDDEELFTRIDYGDDELASTQNSSVALPSISSRADKHERERRRRIKAKKQKQKRRLERQAEKEAAHQAKLDQAMAEEQTIQVKFTSHALTMAYSVQKAMEQKLEQVEDLLEALHMEQEEEQDTEDDDENDEGMENATAVHGSSTTNNFSLLDQILAMILGTIPKKPMSQEDHYKFVQQEHRRIVRAWKDYFGRLPPPIASATATDVSSEDNDQLLSQQQALISQTFSTSSQQPPPKPPTIEMTPEEKRMALGITANDKDDWEDVENWTDCIAEPIPAADSIATSLSSQEKQHEATTPSTGTSSKLAVSSSQPPVIAITRSDSKSAPTARAFKPPAPPKPQVMGLRPGGKVLPP